MKQEEIKDKIQKKYKWHKYKVVNMNRVIKAWKLIEAINTLTKKIDNKVRNKRPMWKTFAYIEMGFCKKRAYGSVTAESMFKERPKRENINKVIRNAQKVMSLIIELQQVKKDLKYIVERTTIKGARYMFGWGELDACRMRKDGTISQMKPSNLISLKERVDYYKEIVPRNSIMSNWALMEKTGTYKMTKNQRTRCKNRKPLKIKI